VNRWSDLPIHHLSVDLQDLRGSAIGRRESPSAPWRSSRARARPPSPSAPSRVARVSRHEWDPAQPAPA